MTPWKEYKADGGELSYNSWRFRNKELRLEKESEEKESKNVKQVGKCVLCNKFLTNYVERCFAYFNGYCFGCDHIIGDVKC